MTTTLKPAPVSILQISAVSGKTFSAEICSTNGLGRVYADSCDTGLTVIGTTGREVVFVVEDEHRDREQELTHWTLRSTCGTFTLVLFNDCKKCFLEEGK